jgi:transposase
MPRPIPLLRDRAYEGDVTRQLAWDVGYIPVVPLKHNRLAPWADDRALYTRRHEIERLFRRLKGVRRLFSRCENLDVMFVAFINFAVIVEGLR